jgi:hypothetical protein
MNLRAIDLMLALKRRRLAQLEAGTAEMSAGVRQAQEGLDDAASQVARCEDAESARQTRIDALFAEATFDPAHLLVNRSVLAALKELTTKAVQQRASAQHRLDEAQQALTAHLRRIQQRRQQIDKLVERRAQTVKQIDDELEDKQDEESEEAAVARLVARSREASRIERQGAQ